jgi:hypothetical protein
LSQVLFEFEHTAEVILNIRHSPVRKPRSVKQMANDVPNPARIPSSHSDTEAMGLHFAIAITNYGKSNRYLFFLVMWVFIGLTTHPGARLRMLPRHI